MMSKDTTVILLAGGVGSRMQSPTPKQFLLLDEKPVLLYSFETLIQLSDVAEIVVVIAKEFRHMFTNEYPVPVSFADPGKRRQDSLANGVEASQEKTSYFLIHDAARPFVTKELAEKTLKAARECGGAVVGTPVKNTIKRCSSEQFVEETVDRTSYFEVQTPQATKRDLLVKGIKHASKAGLTVTDDTSLIERLSYPVKLVEGSFSNIKITTPEDLHLAKLLLPK